jgi:hypothetical protein
MIELIKLLYQTEHSKKGKNYTSENLLCTLITLCMFRKVDIDKVRLIMTSSVNESSPMPRINGNTTSQ